MSYETRYGAHIRSKSDAAASTPEAINARARLGAAMLKARRDVANKFPVITAENAHSVSSYQAERIEFWRREFEA